MEVTSETHSNSCSLNKLWKRDSTVPWGFGLTKSWK